MAIVGPTTPISARQRRVVFQNPGPPVPSGTSFTQSWTDLPPPADVRIAPASAHSLERVVAGTVTSEATHLVFAPYRAGISTKTRILVDGRVLSVLSVQDPEERHSELVLVCAEVVP